MSAINLSFSSNAFATSASLRRSFSANFKLTEILDHKTSFCFLFNNESVNTIKLMIKTMLQIVFSFFYRKLCSVKQQ